MSMTLNMGASSNSSSRRLTGSEGRALDLALDFCLDLDLVTVSTPTFCLTAAEPSFSFSDAKRRVGVGGRNARGDVKAWVVVRPASRMKID